MSKIKVIKKNTISESNHSFNTTKVKLKQKSKQQEMVETIENWISDCRQSTETKTRNALEGLTRLQLEDSVGM
jgi:dipeptidase